MNFALVTFAAMIGLRISAVHTINQFVISTTLFVLSIIFCAWDRRWHRVKHGWDSTARCCYDCIIKLTNNEKQDIEFPLYDSEAEPHAEWLSLQPAVFYLLVIGSIASFFIWGDPPRQP